ncbi:MAG: DUF58 domain-containing protein [Hylemonella sp.]
MGIPSSLLKIWQPSVASLRERWLRWQGSRSPRQDTLELTHRNVYILPSGAGWVLAGTLLVLLLASINYQLSLGYMLTFFVAGSALASISSCHANLRGLRISLPAPQPQFCGSPAYLSIFLLNHAQSTRHGLSIHLQGHQDTVSLDVPANGQSEVRLAMVPKQRGWQVIPPLHLETRFPLGAFRAWALYFPAARVLCYPTPESHPPPLPWISPVNSGSTGPQLAARGDEWDGVRPYRRGDALRSVVWKKVAHSGELVSRDSTSLRRGKLWLDLSQCNSLTREQGLSRLCAWVLQAEHQALDYGLRLPGLRIDPDQGKPHMARCLRALALC